MNRRNALKLMAAAPFAAGLLSPAEECPPTFDDLMSDGKWHYVEQLYKDGKAVQTYVDGTCVSRKDLFPFPKERSAPWWLCGSEMIMLAKEYTLHGPVYG